MPTSAFRHAPPVPPQDPPSLPYPCLCVKNLCLQTLLADQRCQQVFGRCSTAPPLSMRFVQCLAAPYLRECRNCINRLGFNWLPPRPMASDYIFHWDYFAEWRIIGRATNCFVTLIIHIQWCTSPNFGTQNWVRLAAPPARLHVLCSYAVCCWNLG